MPQLCLAVASLALSTSRPVSVVLLANRLSLVLPYLLWYHTLLSSAVVSKRVKPSCNSASLLIIFSLVSASGCTCGHETGGISLNLLFRWFRRAVTPDHSSTGEAERLRQFHGHLSSFCLVRSRAVYFHHCMPIPQMWGSLPRYFPSACSRLGASAHV